jgi:hypothetical protein
VNACKDIHGENKTQATTNPLHPSHSPPTCPHNNKWPTSPQPTMPTHKSHKIKLANLNIYSHGYPHPYRHLKFSKIAKILRAKRGLSYTSEPPTKKIREADNNAELIPL